MNMHGAGIPVDAHSQLCMVRFDERNKARLIGQAYREIKGEPDGVRADFVSAYLALMGLAPVA
jgi:hypothetical protein